MSDLTTSLTAWADAERDGEWRLATIHFSFITDPAGGAGPGRSS